jgi:ElaB/YqjD/DUF883 family membrane-anchored ribosome-binding protein
LVYIEAVLFLKGAAMTNLTQTVQQAAEETNSAIKHAGDSVKSSLASTKKVAQERFGEVESHIAKHPSKAVGIALLAGVALGCVLSRSRHHD